MYVCIESVNINPIYPYAIYPVLQAGRIFLINRYNLNAVQPYRVRISQCNHIYTDYYRNVVRANQ